MSQQVLNSQQKTFTKTFEAEGDPTSLTEVKKSLKHACCFTLTLVTCAQVSIYRLTHMPCTTANTYDSAHKQRIKVVSSSLNIITSNWQFNIYFKIDSITFLHCGAICFPDLFYKLQPLDLLALTSMTAPPAVIFVSPSCDAKFSVLLFRIISIMI